ncbi:MAG: hypothetical protein ACI9S8_000958 [Chlamydiales bacterium]|jgi:hypothetical protein
MTGIIASGSTDVNLPPPSMAPMFFRTASTYGSLVLQERNDDILNIARAHIVQHPIDRERVREDLRELSFSNWLCREDIAQLFSRALSQSEALSTVISRVDEEVH